MFTVGRAGASPGPTKPVRAIVKNQVLREDFAQSGWRFPAKPYQDLAALFTQLV